MHRIYAALAAKADVQHVRLEQDVDYIMRRVQGLGNANTQRHIKALGLVVQTSDSLFTRAAYKYQKLMVSVAQNHDVTHDSVRQHHDRTQTLATSNHSTVIKAISQACESLNDRFDLMAGNIAALAGTSNDPTRKLNTIDSSIEALTNEMRIIGVKAISQQLEQLNHRRTLGRKVDVGLTQVFKSQQQCRCQEWFKSTLTSFALRYEKAGADCSKCHQSGDEAVLALKVATMNLQVAKTLIRATQDSHTTQSMLQGKFIEA